MCIRDSHYTSTGWDAFQEALDRAEEVLADDEALAGDITSAYDDLLNAFEHLEPTADRSALDAALEKAQTVADEIQEGKYLPDVDVYKRQLPETATVNYADGKTEEKSIVWDTIPEENIETDGSFSVVGKLDGISVTVNVLSLIHIFQRECYRSFMLVWLSR